MLPDETDAKQKGASEFLRQRVRDLDKTTTEVSVDLLRRQRQLRPCHDHPLVDDWKQDHFFGMKSFFNRTFDKRRIPGRTRIRAGEVQDDQGRRKRPPRLMFLTGKLTRRTGTMKEPSQAEQRKEKELEKQEGQKRSAAGRSSASAPSWSSWP